MATMQFETGNLKRNLRQRKWLIGLLIFLLASLLAINSFTISQFQIIPLGSNITNQVSYVEPKVQVSGRLPEASLQKGYVVSNKGCRIPDLSPFEPSAMRYFDKPKPIVCEQGTYLPLVNSNSSAIFVDPEARAHYYNESEPTDCCWRIFWRSAPKDNKVAYSKDCHPFEEVAYINDEFIKVECQGKNGTVYVDYFAFVPRKLRVESRCRKQLRLEKLLNGGSRPEKLSVLVVGVDAVSRLNLHRTMPRTVDKLRELGAVELYGYNKVADNTYPNVVPTLSGYSASEFEKICWTKRDDPFDKCPLIWKNFSMTGYRTIFGEDACWMSIFNYLKPGFRKVPTDYYLRSFCSESESMIGNTHKYNAKLCLGTRLTFEVLLEYILKVAEEFADDPYFAFFWQASLTHDSIEYPQLGDDSYHDFLDYLRENELLRNTALVFMSDHGMRWGSFRQTYQGRFEDSLPFVFMALPDWWKDRHPEAWLNLNANARSLTSPFDLHETLVDILEPGRLQPKPKEKSSNNSTTEDTALPRGMSLFKPIPDNRTCDSAGIPEHWCMCQSRFNVSYLDPTVHKVVSFLENEINRKLAKYPRCAQLKASKLIDVNALSHSAKDNKTEKKDEKSFQPYWTDYSVTVRMTPGDAVFESSVRYSTDNGTMSLIDSVSRLNAYGNQSACVDDFHMRLYCYCH